MSENKKRGLALLAFFLADLLTGCVGTIVDLDDDWADSWNWAQKGKYEASATFSQTLDMGNQLSVRITGVNGSVTVRGVPDAQEVVVDAVRRVRSDSRKEAEAHLADLHVWVRSWPREFEIKTVQPEDTNGRTYIVDYEITAPARLLTTVTNGNGAVRLEGIEADMQVMDGNGSVTLVDVIGSSWISVGNGEISAWTVLPMGGQIVHSIGNGGVFLSVQPGVSANFAAKVGNGTISVTGLDLREIVSSPRTLKGVLGSGAGLIDLSTGNGQIRVQGG